MGNASTPTIHFQAAILLVSGLKFPTPPRLQLKRWKLKGFITSFFLNKGNTSTSKPFMALGSKMLVFGRVPSIQCGNTRNLEWWSGFEAYFFERNRTARKLSIVFWGDFEGFINRVGCSNFTSTSWRVLEVLWGMSFLGHFWRFLKF